MGRPATWQKKASHCSATCGLWVTMVPHQCVTNCEAHSAMPAWEA